MGANTEKDSDNDDEKLLILNRLMPKDKETALLEFRLRNKFYVIKTSVPSFWDDELVSKTYKNYNPEHMKRMERKHRIEKELDFERQKEAIRAEEFAKKGIKQAEAVLMP
jgi:hypothetical protein